MNRRPPSIDGILERVARAGRPPSDASPGTGFDASLADVLERTARQGRSDTNTRADGAASPSASPDSRSTIRRTLVRGMAATVLLAAMAFAIASVVHANRLVVPPMRADALASVGAGVVAPISAAAVIGLVVDNESSGAVWQSQRLLDRIAPPFQRLPGYRIERLEAGGWEQGLLALKVQPRVAIVRYDALQAARRAPPEWQMPSLRVVAPLTTEAIHFIARADSPLRFIHDLESRTIDAGPADGARALTAHAVYRAMFGESPAVGTPAASEDEALDRLGRDATLDVVVIVGAAPASRLARLTPADAGRLKLLAYDADDARDRRALSAFFPMPVQALSTGAFPAIAETTLGVMSFLVTATSDDSTTSIEDDAMAALSSALCASRTNRGDWLDGGQQLDVGWPYSSSARAALRQCRSDSRTSTKDRSTRSQSRQLTHLGNTPLAGPGDTRV